MAKNESNQSTQKFDVRLDRDAAKEYNKLTQPVLDIVNKSIDELEYRADEIGKPLGNKRDMKLAGCKEIKLRDAGIRIVYRITNETVDILRVVYILTIEKRSEDFVFRIASKRYKIFRNADQKALLKTARRWEKR